MQKQHDPSDTALEALRAQIDTIDDQLLDLFTQRMGIAASVARHKKEQGQNVLSKERERAILERMTQAAGDDLAIYTKVFFNNLFDLSRSAQTVLMAEKSDLEKRILQAVEETPKLFPRQAVVACQGVEGSYSQQACDKLFPLPSIMYFHRFDNVFNAVDKGLCRYGILPIENSSYGSINEVYDLMRKYRFHIVRSVKLKISHALLALPDTDLSQIKEIRTHEQALGQCSDFIKAHPHIRVVGCENTALAAKEVAESGRKDLAAISSMVCADLYGLTALAHDIQNSDDNYTRFICICKDMEIYPGAGKLSLMMAVSHTPGALYRTLAKFSALGVNISKLESRPIPGTDFFFMFYFDIEGPVEDPATLGLLGDLAGYCDPFFFLGAYQEL